MTQKSHTKSPNWQAERAKARGTARTRRAALAMFQPHSPVLGGSTLPGTEPDNSPGSAATLPANEEDMPTKLEELKTSTAVVENLSQMTLNLSPGFLMEDPTQALRNDIGKEKIAPMSVDMWGAITHGIRHPNKKFDGKSIRWIGEMGFRTRTGQIGEADSAYLPLTVERKLLNAGAPVIEEDSGDIPPRFLAEFSVVFVCEPYTPPPGMTGPSFHYACYNRMGHRHNINRLAPPDVQAMLPAPETQPLLGYDPETGEIDDEPVVEAPAEAAE